MLLIGAAVLFSSQGARAQQEIQHPQPVPYADILTSKMKKADSEKTVTLAETAEMEKILTCSDHSQTKVRNIVNLICLMFLFGAFCAIWAQNTARNPLFWFFAGVCFNFVTVLVILRKNAKIHRRRRFRRKGSSYVDYAQFN